MPSQKIYLFSLSSYPDTIHIPSLDVEHRSPDIEFSKYDSFLITSKQAIKALENYENLLLAPAICVSTKTAEAYQKIGGEILAVGDGYGKSLIAKVQGYDKTRRWLYLRAQSVASDFVGVLQNQGYAIDEKIMYKSECSQAILDVDVEEDAILIFTSPSSVKCYLKTHSFSQKQKIVAIGTTTQQALPENVSAQVCDASSIESCVKVAQTL
jgi:uroporphyrinogen-III synthase